MSLALAVGTFAVLLALVLGHVMERHSPAIGTGLFPETPDDVVAWREAQDRRADREPRR